MKPTRRIVLEVDWQDHEAILRAVARRQSWRVGGDILIPEGDGDLRGRLLAEICRGWSEFIDLAESREA